MSDGLGELSVRIFEEAEHRAFSIGDRRGVQLLQVSDKTLVAIASGTQAEGTQIHFKRRRRAWFLF